MGFCDRAADRQSHADPIALGRGKRLEEPGELVRIEPLPDLAEIRLARAEPAKTRIGVRDYCRNRLIDFMRDRRRHLFQHHYPIKTREIGLGLLQSLLRQLPVGDVDGHYTKESRRAI